MSDLLIRNLDPDMQRSLERRARAHDRDVAEEAKALLRTSLGMTQAPTDIGKEPPPGMGMGTWMRNLVPSNYRGDDLLFELDSPESQPPDFD